MLPRSPTLEGFRAICRRPSLGLAEIAWRWSFGSACITLLAFSFFEYLDTLPVTPRDLLLMRTRQPALISRAIGHIFSGSGLRLVEVFVVLGIALSAGWIVIAALARAATVKALVAYFQEVNQSSRPGGVPVRCQLRSLYALNFLRVAVTLAATAGCVGALLLSHFASPARHPAPGTAALILLSVAALVWLIWSGMNWLLSLAAVFVVARGRDTFGALASAVALCRDRAGSVFAAGTWFGLAHIAAFVVATTVVAFPLGLAGVLPRSIVFSGVALVTLLYFAVADCLYVGRLASYVGILELPEASVPL